MGHCLKTKVYFNGEIALAFFDSRRFEARRSWFSHIYGESHLASPAQTASTHSGHWANDRFPPIAAIAPIALGSDEPAKMLSKIADR